MTNHKPGALIIAQNNQFAIVNKPSGVTISPDKTGDISLIEMIKGYLKCPLFLCHRIDRPVSGVVLFAKTKKAQIHFNAAFQDKTIQKEYLAVVKTAPEPSKGVWKDKIMKDGQKNRAFIVNKDTKEVEKSKEANLSYELKGGSDNFQLIHLKPETGRFHQIRAQLGHHGHPIKGDVKYGFKRSNKDRSIHLHAWKLSFTHPISKEKMQFEAPLPKEDALWGFFETQLK